MGEPDDELSKTRADRMAAARMPDEMTPDEEEAWFDPAQCLTEDDRAYRILEYIGIPDWSAEQVSYIAAHIREHLLQTMNGPCDEDMDLGDPFGEGGEPEPYPIERCPREEE